MKLYSFLVQSVVRCFDFPEETIPTATEIPDTIPVSSSADWQTAFGFTSSTTELNEDDLGETTY
jgi:hypothetical protein